MNQAFLTLLSVLILLTASAQQTPAGNLKKELEIVKTDTGRALIFSKLSAAYVFSKPDSGFFYASKGLQLAHKINYTFGEAINTFWLSTYYRVTGYSLQGMQYANRGLALFIALNNAEGIIWCTNMLAWLMGDQGDYPRSFEYALQAIRLSKKHNNLLIEWAYSTVAEYYEQHTAKLDSALFYAKKADSISQDYNWNRIVLGRVHAALNNDSLAFQYYRKAISKTTYSKDSSDGYIGIAKVFEKNGQRDSAIYYANQALHLARQSGFLLQVLPASEILTRLYRSTRQNDSTVKYMQISIEANDSLFSQGKIIQFQTFLFNEKLQQQELEANKMQYGARTRTYVLLMVTGFFLFLAIILYRNNKIKQKANAQLQQQKETIETTLTELKATQAQLIQSEKMASLGELTAGIAHEIQNPLNFVNNFSEVSNELLDEMKLEIDNKNFDEVKAISNNVKDNLSKILHHGKRADSIVKGMLQHSLSNSGQKEPTDINALADEFLRLAYHGLRTKDKTFNATTKTDYDENIGNINVIPQDIGRVIFNLITNAFYAVNEKSQQAKTSGETYEPTVTVKTKKTKDTIQIIIEDNGNGIPQHVLNKIFQPFYTTKPTGEGSGLGLSLSYDIVKAHGGELKVDSKEGESAEFIIYIPVK